MAFIVNKKSVADGQEKLLYYLVENYREGNKVKRKTIFRLRSNATLDEFLAVMQRREIGILGRLAHVEEQFSKAVAAYKQKPNSPLLESIKSGLTRSVEKVRAELQECQNIQEKIKHYM